MLARSLLAAALAAVAIAAAAQPAGPRERAAAPLPAYQSAYEGYRPYADEPRAPWREVNDTVERVGGHAGVLREEAQKTGTSTPPATPPAAAPKGGGHDAAHHK